MRVAQEKQLRDLRESMQCTIDSLTAQISALAASGRGNTGKLYGRKSEKSSRLGRREDDDDRNSGKDNFDGTPGSDKSCTSSGKTCETSRADGDKSGSTLKALQKKILRTCPGTEMKVERIDYSKAKAYTDSPTYHKLEDYYNLPCAFLRY